MEQNLGKRKYIRQYVLGVPNLKDLEQFEERLLIDAKLLQEVAIVEDEVFCEYLSGTLSDSERETFETHFLTTSEGKRKLQFFRSFSSQLPASSKAADFTNLPGSWKRFLPAFLRGESPALRISFAAAIVLLVLVGLSLALQNWRNQPLDIAIFKATLGKSPTKDIEGGELTVVDVPSGTDAIELLVPISDTTITSFEASLFSDEGDEKLNQKDLQAQLTQAGRVVPLRVPSSVLASGDYRLKLKGRVSADKYEDVATHSFRVIRR